jgi:hypothetical protein
LHLPRSGSDKSLLAETNGDAPKACEALDIFVPLVIPNTDARTAGDNERPDALVPFDIRCWMQVVSDVAALVRVRWSASRGQISSSAFHSHSTFAPLDLWASQTLFL